MLFFILVTPSYHNPADYVMEVACGEHGEAVENLVMAVNNGKCHAYNRRLTPDSFVPVQTASLAVSNEKSINLASISVPTSSNSTILTANPLHDSVVVDIDLIKHSNTNTNPDYALVNMKDTRQHLNGAQLNAIGPTTSLLHSSSESIVAIESQIQYKNHINGFPTSTWTQFWILLKRTFITIIRDQTLTQMRLVSHIVVGAIIGMIYYGIGNDASKIMSNAGCLFFTTLFTMFTAVRKSSKLN